MSFFKDETQILFLNKLPKTLIDIDKQHVFPCEAEVHFARRHYSYKIKE